MSSSRSRQSKFSRIPSQGHKGLFRHAMPVFPPPSISNDSARDNNVVSRTRENNVVYRVKANARVNYVVSQPKAKNAESFDKRGGLEKRKASDQKGIFEILDSPTSQFSELALKKANKMINNKRFGGFLEDCSLCKKKLNQTTNLYMYGDLGAFCSPNCRDDRMLIDGFQKEFLIEFPHFGIPWTQSKLLRAHKKVFGQKPSNWDDYNSNSD